MAITLHNSNNVLKKLVYVHNPVTCLSIRSLRITGALRESATRTPEAVFLKANPEVPIIAVTDRENVDMIGPPDTVSNLRPIIRKRLLHETALQRQLRELQDKTQEWNQKFWFEHNTKFIQERQNFIKSHKISIDQKRILTADEMSEFYKKFLDDNWKTHFNYNFEWYKRIHSRAYVNQNALFVVPKKITTNTVHLPPSICVQCKIVRRNREQ
ncbi:hypothetical protein Trydic_g11257 [Trypoxylus dichotomus]